MFSKRIMDNKILYVSQKECLSYSRGWLYFDNYNDNKNKVFIGSKRSKCKLIERLLRGGPRCATKIDENNYIISLHGKVLKYCSTDNTIKVEHEFDKGMNNPLEFLSVRNSETNDNDIYYGEYIWNTDKGPVAVYKRSKGKWNKVYEFPSNTILHIHNIVNDPYRNCFIVLTGDSDKESGIWLADYAFNNVRPLLIGKQQYRSCVAFPVEDGIVYATDTPLEVNFIYHIILNEMDVVRIEKEYEMPGPCIYGTKINKELFFSTSVEPDSTLPKWIYRLTYRLGKGVKSRYSHIINRDCNGNYSDCYRVKKDRMPIWLFQFGNIIFPENETKDLYVVMQSTKLGHNNSYKLEK